MALAAKQRADRPADRLELERVQRVRRRQPERQPRGRRPARARSSRRPRRSRRCRRSRTSLAPATRNLLPAVSEIPAANAATIDARPRGRRPRPSGAQDQIRPFVVAARPLVRNLRPAVGQPGDRPRPNLSKVVHGAEPLSSTARLQPGRQPARLPVVARVARPQRPHRCSRPRTPTATSARCSSQASCASLAQIAQSIPGSEARART